MNFTAENYRELLRFALVNGYSFVFFGDNSVKNKKIYLRHDVDFSLDNALEFAILESELNIHSTYFFIVTSPFYNLMSEKSQTILQKIIKLGHKIGLHFDSKAYEKISLENIVHLVKNEKKILEMIVDTKITAVSFHRPNPVILNADIYLGRDCINTYSKKYFDSIKYISDSRMNWKQDPFKIIESNQFPEIQILTHPIWYGKNNGKISTILGRYICFKNNELLNDLNDNFTNVNEFLDLDKLIMEVNYD